MLAVDILRLLNIAGCLPLFILFAMRLQVQKLKMFRVHLKGTLFAVAGIIVGTSGHVFEDRGQPFDPVSFVAHLFILVAIIYWTRASYIGWKRDRLQAQQRG